MPVALTSASLDPYADPANPADVREAVDAVKLQRWVTRLYHAIDTHRSPLIAAEVMLSEITDYAHTMQHPGRLHLATAILLLHACVPVLQPALQDVLRAAMYELLPAIFFTRASYHYHQQQLSGHSSHAASSLRGSSGNSTGAGGDSSHNTKTQGKRASMEEAGAGSAAESALIDAPHSMYREHDAALYSFVWGSSAQSSRLPSLIFQRRSFAECFHDVYAQYISDTHALANYASRDRLKDRVLARVVTWLHRVWLRVCFTAWRQHSRALQQKKVILHNLVQRNRYLHMVPQTVRAWRQHAHMITLRAKMSRNMILQQQLDTLAPVEQALLEEHTRARQDLLSQIQNCEVAQRAASETELRYTALKKIHRRTVRSLRAHWATWQQAMALLFGDAELLSLQQDCNKSNNEKDAPAAASVAISSQPGRHISMPSNITDCAATLANRARIRTERLGIQSISCLLMECYHTRCRIAHETSFGMPTQSHDGKTARMRMTATAANMPHTTGVCAEDSVSPDMDSPALLLHSAAESHLTQVEHTLSARSYSRSHSRSATILTTAGKSAGVHLDSGRMWASLLSDRPARIEEVMAWLREVCWPVLPPLLYEDVAQSDQNRLHLTMQFVRCVYGGGHCSLFLPHTRTPTPMSHRHVLNTGARRIMDGSCASASLLPRISWKDSLSVSTTSTLPSAVAARLVDTNNTNTGPLNTPGITQTIHNDNYTNSASNLPNSARTDDIRRVDGCGGGHRNPSRVKQDEAKEQQPPKDETDSEGSSSSSMSDDEDEDETESDYCTRMMSDVSQHLDKMHTCEDSLEQYLLSVRRCMSASELERLHDALGSFYRRWSVLGVPLCRAKVEAVLCSTVRLEDRPIVRALYPEHGIQSPADLAHYLTSVEEFTSWPILDVVDKLVCEYALDVVDETRFVLADAEMRHFMRQRASCVDALARYVSKSENGKSAPSRSRTVAMMRDKLGLTETEAASAWEATVRLSSCSSYASLHGKGQLGREDMETLLYMIAQVVNPSPFCSMTEKMAQTLDVCACFLKFGDAEH